MHDWYFAETTAPFTPTANDYSYDLPYNFGRAIAIRVDVDDVHYILEEVALTRNGKDCICTETLRPQTIRHIIILRGIVLKFIQYLVQQPLPILEQFTTSKSGRYAVRRLYNKYGLITNGATALTSAAAVWTTAFVGRYFKINTGARWYEISARVSDTALTLKSRIRKLRPLQAILLAKFPSFQRTITIFCIISPLLNTG